MGNFEHDYPAISDLRARAKRRMPRFVWEYLDSGTGAETAPPRNRAALDAVQLMPRVMLGPMKPDLSTRIIDQEFALPIGMSPVGATGAMWPGGEDILARLAASENVPYTLSTVATRTPEDIGPLAGANGWFQLYPLGGDGVIEDVLKRVKDAGFSTVVLTADVPINSRRERQRRAGFNIPPKTTPRVIWDVARRPAWLMQIARSGMPAYGTLEKYAPKGDVTDIQRRLSPEFRPNLHWDDMQRLRDAWDGPIILKGVMSAEDAVEAKARGFEALWVSNHAGRQLDAAPASIAMLPAIRAAVGDAYPLLFDSGVESGLDVARALALGADFVMAGRAFIFGTAAFGERGAKRSLDILRDDLINVMWQLGVETPRDLRGCAIS